MQIAFGSAFELETFHRGISDLNLLDENHTIENLLTKIKEAQMMLSGFIKILEAES